jgi:hypothetical protein
MPPGLTAVFFKGQASKADKQVRLLDDGWPCGSSKQHVSKIGDSSAVALQQKLLARSWVALEQTGELGRLYDKVPILCGLLR